MEVPSLVPILAVGLSEVPGGVVLVSKDTVIYPAGMCLARFSSSSSVAPAMSDPCAMVRGITAVAGCQSRAYVAAAESTVDGMPPQVGIFDATSLARLATLTGPRVSGKYTSLCFSGDGTTLLGVGQEEDSKASVAHLWDWQTGLTPVATAEASGAVVKASIDPKFSSNLVTQTDVELLVWRLAPSGFKKHAVVDMQKPAGTTYIDHVFNSSGRLVVATSQREIQIIERTQIVTRIKLDRGVVGLCITPDNLLIVAMQKGYLQMFSTGTGGPTEYAIVAELVVPVNSHSPSLDVTLRCLSLDSTGERMACVMRHGPLYTVNLQYAKSSTMSSAGAALDMFELLFPSVHDGPIIGASLAIKRDVLATASRDLTVRVWQYNPLRLVVTHMCHNTPTAIGLDPWGREMVVCYVDSVRFYDVVEGMVLENGELRGGGGSGVNADGAGGGGRTLEKCSHVKYSPNGSLIAIVGGVSAKDIFIFSVLHKRQLAVLKGHFSSVADIAWSDDGQYLASTSSGAVFTWRMDGFVRCQEDTVKTYENDAVAVSPDFDMIVAGDSTQGIRLLATSRGANTAAHWGLAAPDSNLPSTNNPTSPITPSRRGMYSKGGKSSRLDQDMAPGTGEAAELQLAGTYTAIMQPLKCNLAMAVTPQYKVLIGGGPMGRMRVCRLPPGPQGPTQELSPHSADCQAVIAHHNGQLVFTADSSGLFFMHALVLPSHAAAAAAAVPRAAVQAAPPGAKVVWRPSPSLTADILAHSAKLAAAQGLLEGLRGGPGGSSGAGAGAGLGGHAQGGAEGGTVTSIVSVRAQDLQQLKDQARELKDALAKGVSDSDFRVYEREQAVRRELEGVLARLGGQVEGLVAENERASADAGSSARRWATQAEESHQSYQRSLAQQQDDYETKLVIEINRTNAAEQALTQLRATFSRKLESLAAEKAGEARDVRGAVAGLRAEMEAVTAAAGKDEKRPRVTRSASPQPTEGGRGTVAGLRAETEAVTAAAGRAISAASDHMELETGLDLLMNEEEIGRVMEAREKVVEAAEARHAKLLGKHVLLSGLANSTAKENEALKATNIALREERTDMAGQIHALTEQLSAMHAAWRERDARQKGLDGEAKDMAFQLQQAQLYATLATTRIQELSAELVGVGVGATRSGAAGGACRMGVLLTSKLWQSKRTSSGTPPRPPQSALDAALPPTHSSHTCPSSEVVPPHSLHLCPPCPLPPPPAPCPCSAAPTTHSLVPLKAAKEAATDSVARLEGVQLRQLERQRRVIMDNGGLASRLDNALTEVKQLKDNAYQRQHYFGNFAAQMFQTLHTTPCGQWPVLFGRLAVDFEAGKDKLVWAHYVSDKASSNDKASDAAAAAAAAGEDPMPNAAAHTEEMGEVTAHLLHAERRMGVLAASRERSEGAHRSATARLQAENSTIMAELNECKRDLKASHEGAELMTAQLTQMRMLLPMAAVAGGNAAASSAMRSYQRTLVASSSGSNARVSRGGCNSSDPGNNIHSNTTNNNGNNNSNSNNNTNNSNSISGNNTLATSPNAAQSWGWGQLPGLTNISGHTEGSGGSGGSRFSNSGGSPRSGGSNTDPGSGLAPLNTPQLTSVDEMESGVSATEEEDSDATAGNAGEYDSSAAAAAASGQQQRPGSSAGGGAGVGGLDPDGGQQQQQQLQRAGSNGANPAWTSAWPRHSVNGGATAAAVAAGRGSASRPPSRLGPGESPRRTSSVPVNWSQGGSVFAAPPSGPNPTPPLSHHAGGADDASNASMLSGSGCGEGGAVPSPRTLPSSPPTSPTAASIPAQLPPPQQQQPPTMYRSSSHATRVAPVSASYPNPLSLTWAAPSRPRQQQQHQHQHRISTANAPMRVDGTMPVGGWWLGQESGFEVAGPLTLGQHRPSASLTLSRTTNDLNSRGQSFQLQQQQQQQQHAHPPPAGGGAYHVGNANGSAGGGYGSQIRGGFGGNGRPSTSDHSSSSNRYGLSGSSMGLAQSSPCNSIDSARIQGDLGAMSGEGGDGTSEGADAAAAQAWTKSPQPPLALPNTYPPPPSSSAAEHQRLRSSFTPPTPHGTSSTSMRVIAASTAHHQQQQQLLMQQQPHMQSQPSQPSQQQSRSHSQQDRVCSSNSGGPPAVGTPDGSGSASGGVPGAQQPATPLSTGGQQQRQRPRTTPLNSAAGRVVLSVSGGVPPLPLHQLAHHGAAGAAVSGSSSSSGGGGNSATLAASLSIISGQLRPGTPSRVTTLGAGFRSFVPRSPAASGSRRR
ncbi:MAG: hypothetical protein WDW36_000847 [Sanguina aurantia]